VTRLACSRIFFMSFLFIPNTYKFFYLRMLMERALFLIHIFLFILVIYDRIILNVLRFFINLLKPTG